MNRIDGGGSVRQVELEQPKQVIKPEALTTNNENVSANFASKLLELSFTGAASAARFQRRPDPPAPTPVTTPLQTNGSGTETNYRIGDPTRPNIRHDNGFRQNPNDPNDTTLRPTIEPTQADRDYYDDQLSQVTWAQRADNFNVPFTDKDDEARRLEDGIDAYRHFLEGNGADRTFSYEEYVEEDPSGRTTLNNAIADTQRGVEQLYNEMIARDPSLANQTITFNVTSGAITASESNTEFPYPATENWQKAIGGHSIWNSATVTVTPPSTPGGKPTFSMDYTLHAEDRYNFNPGQNDIATGAPDSLRGRLEMTGLAHQYMNYATLNRDVTWTQGDIQSTTQVSGGEGR